MPEQKPVAVVTAGTAGIGLSIAHALAKDGYHVVICSRKPQNVEQAVQEIQEKYGQDSASGLPCHVADGDDRAKLLSFSLERSSVIDVLVLNAAASPAFGLILDTTEAQWDKLFDVNVKSAFMLIKLFEPYLTRGSSIVLVTSIAAYHPLPGVGVYSVTKTALLGLCKVLSLDLASRGIRVNAVAPGIIKTKFSEGLWKGKTSLAEGAISDQSRANKLFHIPLRRIGAPEDVAGVVSFLVSKHAGYITGETIVMAGGAMSKL